MVNFLTSNVEDPANGIAGSGKTLAYGIALIEYLLEKPENKWREKKLQPSAIILCSVRERVIQVYQELLNLCAGTQVRPVVVYGGVAVDDQLRTIQNGAAIIVCTPGRLRHFFSMALEKPSVDGCIYPYELTHLILDEADDLLSLAFKKEVDSILTSCH